MLTGDGRITLSGRTLVRTDSEGRRREEELAGDEAVGAAYRDHFGILLRPSELTALGRAGSR